jgi:uncharacterized repeat protein (TIGR03803 family)
MTKLVEHQGLISGISRGTASSVLLLVTMLVPVVVVTQSLQAQTFRVLYSFTGSPDGSGPDGLLRDAAGNIYGTTGGGGAAGHGTVFKLNGNGKETVLYSFTGGTDGSGPNAGVVMDKKRNLYGTTYQGGGSGCFESLGCGTVFKLDTTGKETVLHSFRNGSDGSSPEGGLIWDADGNLYGTASGAEGGGATQGVVFKLAKTGHLTVLYSFTGGSDGGLPQTGVLRDAKGNLYGTASSGGVKACKTILRTFYCGVVFKLDNTGKESVLHKFGNGAWEPAGLIFGSAGDFYGTTDLGGNSSCDFTKRGCGVVFRMNTSGSFTVLRSFKGSPGGARPSGNLIQDAVGNLYGTTYYGGTGNCNDGDGKGCGTVFKLDEAGKLTMLHSFTGGADGAYPGAGLITDANGNIYGTAVLGGDAGDGVVFELTP